jgi:hypothetical protein
MWTCSQAGLRRRNNTKPPTPQPIRIIMDGSGTATASSKLPMIGPTGKSRKSYSVSTRIPATPLARVRRPDGKLVERVFQIQKRAYPISRIDGLPPSQVDRYSEEDLARIEASTTREQEGDRSSADFSAFRERFT